MSGYARTAEEESGLLKRNGICYIIGAGACYGLSFSASPEDFIIAADGGMAYLEQQGIEADLLIGDFDSLQEEPACRTVIRLEPVKDATDAYAAMLEGIKRGYDRFCFYCCTGGRRFDHTLANIALLVHLAEHGKIGYLFDEYDVMTVVKDGSISFKKQEKGFISVFSVSEISSGVDIAGLKYELRDAVLHNTFPIGASNECIGRESRISVRKGMLLVLYPKELYLKEQHP